MAQGAGEMSRKELIEALSDDLAEGDWFWPDDDCEEAFSQIDEIISHNELETPFEVIRSVQLRNVWVVPYTTDDDDADYKTFHTKEEADVFFASLKKEQVK
jgi:hypothetical protein